ncbi:MAG: hypothetical protein KDA57_17950 [Planctomycetales bacterium]|nr:hypothetical protein [Planctomycetales bacterium]
MPRGWILGIVCLAAVGNLGQVSWAQEGRPQSSPGMSFSERLAALRDTFRREKTPAEVQQHSRPSTKGKTPSRSAQSTRSSNTQPNRETSQLSQAANSIPNALFRRNQVNESSPSRANDYVDPPREESTQRVGSASSRTASSRTTRKSTTVSDKHSLDTALSEMLSAPSHQTQEAIQIVISDGDSNEDKQTKPQSIRVSPAKPTISTSTSTTTTSSSAAAGLFDVHKALVSGMPETQSVASSKSYPAATPQASATSSASTKPLVVENPLVNAPLSSEPASKGTPSAALETLPKVEEEQPTAQQPSPTAQEPATAGYPETNQYPKTNRAAIATDDPEPFANNAEEAFAANPMRSKAPESAAPVREQPAANQFFEANRDYEPAREALSRSYKQPVIVSHVEGPRTIMVGQEASYQVTLENTSDIDAKSISAAVRVPEWAELLDVMSNNGAVLRGGGESADDVLEWQIQELAAKSSATLRMRLIPRSGRPLQLGVEWSQAPTTTETTVEVQEPKLEVALSGPQEVLFGQSQRYRLILRNPGTGVADQIEVRLIPPGGDEQSATNQTIGALQPGEVREIELELTAREAGELIMRASAVAAGGLTAETVKSVLCRKPELEVDWRGPDTKYSGTVSAYYIRVQNPGTATTGPVALKVELPEGSKFVSASDGYSFNSERGILTWRLASLNVDEAQYVQFRCQMNQPGVNRFNVNAQVEGGQLSDGKTIQTNIVALADLKLEVIDPQGPLPLADSAIYEIRVLNRGTTAAKDVSVVGLFSAGIDPVSIEGAQYTERDGRVTFHPIKSLPAGKEIVLRIRAKANEVGTHIFRAEVVCQDLDIKLAAEEATRFFKDEFRWEDSQTPYSADNDETVNR